LPRESACVSTQSHAPGNPLATGGSFSQPFQFAGQQADPTGLYNLRARLYDPGTGRFMQQDPLFGNSNDPRSLNRYTYVENDPATATDPAGWCDTGVAGDPSCNGSGPSSAGSPMIGPLAEEPSPSPDTDPGQASVGNQAVNQVSQASYRLFGGLLRSIWTRLQDFVSDESGSIGVGGQGEEDPQLAITFGHGARHLEGTGLNQEEVEAAITQSIRDGTRGAAPVGPFWGRVTVAGQQVEFRAYPVGSARIHVGTYYPVP
jgi:RHS repeat-associated protein